ncbi:AfsR/SARP family transcriptional regulator [Kitasatospora viridis]|uniref:DNA-binding SARP family transcriptional activator n=1 Tax=Kitasatospora viridis TaxID=281105 RepID=A0A561UD95_9ACTN|nr:AfsR/SARP family transcriptional regulator [Kitasatospora viridis]TWF97308.1 DNA-binding SARP family transcriptional activator [Kitasatospora viridis]
MEIRILGPLTVRHRSVDLVPSAPKPRQVLALLAARVNQTVTVDDLACELWDQEPPRSALNTIQTYITQLRRPLARAAAPSSPQGAGPQGAEPQGAADPVLVMSGRGYQLRTPVDLIDTASFDTLAEQGRQALAAGQNAAAADALRRALEVWRGEFLEDTRLGPMLRIHHTRLKEERQRVLEQRLEADLRLGRHAELLGELAGLTLLQPLQENVHGFFMQALWLSGRRPQALDVFQSLRRRLVRQLGLEPGARLRELHHQILGEEAGTL